MSTQPLTISSEIPAPLAGDTIAYGAIHLEITSLERSLTFWRDLIGLEEIARSEGAATLGTGGRALLVLHETASQPLARGHAGLYHLAIHLPDPVEFARIVVRLAQHRVPQSPTDHVFSKATYLYDPDGIMLELTLETPERFGSIEITPGSVVMYDNEGRRRSPTDALDVAAAVAPLAGGDPDGPLPAGTYLGHVHLHVPDLQRAYSFYRDVLGFEEHAYMAAIGMADLGAGGVFPHRIAANIWNGPQAQPAPEGTARMRAVELLVRDGGRLQGIADHASTEIADGVLRLEDPAGNRFLVRVAG